MRTPLGFVPPSTTSTTEARSTWVYLTQHLPLSAFLTPAGVFFSRSLATLFHAAAAPGVFASRAFPTRTAGDRLRPPPHMALRDLTVVRLSPGEPCAVSNATPRAPLVVGGSTTRLTSPATVRVASWVSHPSVRTHDKRFKPAVSRCSPDVFLLQGTSFHPPAIRHHPLRSIGPTRMPTAASPRGVTGASADRLQGFATSETRVPLLPKQLSGTQPSWSFSPVRTQ